MNDPIESIKFDRGIVAKIYHDTEPLNPRKEYDNVATMACWHGRYDLGDEQPGGEPLNYFRGLIDDTCPHCEGTGDDESGEQDKYGYYPDCSHCEGHGIIPAEQVMEEFKKTHLILPLYLYDHSGLTISTGPFGCRWDSGQVGWIYVNKARAQAEWGDRTEDEILGFMKAEVQEYDHYLTGEVYGYMIEDAAGEHLDSCWGYSGDISYVTTAATEAAAYYVQKAEKEVAEAAYWAERDVVTV